MERFYGNAIWTNHALERLSQRGLSQKLAWTAFQYPDRSVKLGSDGSMQYQKAVGESVVTVVAKKNDGKQWVIISCWIDPPLPGTTDHFKKLRWQKYRQAGWLGKFWMQIQKNLFGLDF